MEPLILSLTRIRNTNRLLADAVRSARADIAAVEKRKELTAEAKASAAKAREEQLREEVREIKEVGKSALEEIRAAAPQRAGVDPAEAARLWRRYERRLDQGEDPLTIARDLVKRGEAAGLQVLTEELPDYQRSTPEGKGQHQSERDLPLTAIRELERPFLTPEEIEHRDAIKAGEGAARMLELNCGLLAKDGLTLEQIFVEDSSQNIDLTEAA